ncbi:MAG: septum formation initiator family protein [Deltaproteobacteria bacterium]|nr:septum formation initiator family protein [Deltaproteobacteria bacterium]MBF0524719.1 septum formation initiator family protein [Deltaproteobacteria bacterium]
MSNKKYLLVMVCLITSILAAYSVFFSTKALSSLYQLNKEKVLTLEGIEHIKMQNEKLCRQIYRIKTDRKYLEEIARQDLGLIRENEIVFQFDNKESQVQKAEPTPPANRSGGPVQKIIRDNR